MPLTPSSMDGSNRTVKTPGVGPLGKSVWPPAAQPTQQGNVDGMWREEKYEDTIIYEGANAYHHLSDWTPRKVDVWNYSAQWVHILNTNIFIPPYTFGGPLPLPAALGNLSVVWQAPANETQPAGSSGDYALLTWRERLPLTGPGFLSLPGASGASTVTANQGIPASAGDAWPVEIENFPATQPVSGNVDVTNFPATQPVSGTVIANQGTPASWSTTDTEDGAQGTGLNPPSGGSGLLGFLSGIYTAIIGTLTQNLSQVGGNTVKTGGVNGSLGVGGLAADGTAFAGDPVPVGGYDGTDARTFRSASASVMTTSPVVGAQLVTHPPFWSVYNFPTTNVQAIATKAAGGSNVRHVCTGFIVTLAAESGLSTPVDQFWSILDGVTTIWIGQANLLGANGNIYTYGMTGLNLVGSANTAMSIQFNAAGGADTDQTVCICGYDVT